MNTPPNIPPGSIVLGVGIDLVEVSRIEGVLERQRDAFKKRVFTSSEQEYCDGMKFPGPHYAVRFAAKEAVSKAFGTGIGEQFGWKSAGVRKNPSGEPWIELDAQGEILLRKKGGTAVLVSLAHTREHATAIALIVRNPELEK